MKPNDRWTQLIAAYQSGEMTDPEFAELEELLKQSPEARTFFHRSCRLDAQLRRMAGEPIEAGTPGSPVAFFPLRPATWAAAAALLLGAMMIWMLNSRPQIVAELISSEDASWESNLPTEPGSKLTSGRMRLTSGLATIRFRSGAEMMLEAPARLSLLTPMRAHLDSGAAVMNVPESAIGFILETPDGRVIDHGTSFAVSVADGGGHSDFEVIEGEISVQLAATGEEVRLVDQQSATIVERTLTTYQGPLPERDVAPEEKVVRLGTKGRSLSVIRANKPKWLHPDKLMVKRRNEPSNHERRTFFAFDLTGIDFEQVKSVRLRLNQVPSNIGYATRLPKISDIGVYGMTNPSKADWSQDTTWEEGPTPEDGVLLGHLEIPRSQQVGSRLFESEALVDFLKSRAGESVTFVLDGQIDPVTGLVVGSMVIAFASDTHPEAPGPMLEFLLKD